MDISIPSKVLKFAVEIEKLGGRAYLVGGSIRDAIMNRYNKDFDICVTGLKTIEEFTKNFKEAELVGASFPVFKLWGMDIAFARKERKIDTGKKGFETISSENITIEEDLIRRDFTVNAMAWDILEEKLIDPYGGYEDIQKRRLKAVSKAFSEDPSRVYRGARFSATLDMEVDEETLKLMNTLKSELNTLFPEQVFEELKKALCGKVPSKFFKTLKNADVLDVHFKEIYNMIGVEQPVKWHPEGDVFNHTMDSIDTARNILENVPNCPVPIGTIMFGVLVHDFGKTKTPREEWPHHKGHDIRGIELIKSFCKKLKLPSNWKKAGLEATKYHMKAGMFYDMTPAKQTELIERFSQNSILQLEGLEIVVNGDRGSREHNNPIQFADLGRKMIKEVNFKNVCNNSDEPNIIKSKLHQARVKWMKEHVRR